jgi:hypothetical protein
MKMKLIRVKCKDGMTVEQIIASFKRTMKENNPPNGAKSLYDIKRMLENIRFHEPDREKMRKFLKQIWPNENFVVNGDIKPFQGLGGY